MKKLITVLILMTMVLLCSCSEEADTERIYDMYEQKIDDLSWDTGIVTINGIVYDREDLTDACNLAIDDIDDDLYNDRKEQVIADAIIGRAILSLEDEYGRLGYEDRDEYIEGYDKGFEHPTDDFNYYLKGYSDGCRDRYFNVK